MDREEHADKKKYIEGEREKNLKDSKRKGLKEKHLSERQENKRH